jgi:hypothetical protein
VNELNEWAKSLKPGDQIAMRRGYGYATYTILTVERVTAAQVVAGDYRFNKESQRLVGSSGYESVTMWPVTQEIREKVEAVALRNWLNNLTRTGVPLGVMRAMKAAFDASPRD